VSGADEAFPAKIAFEGAQNISERALAPVVVSRVEPGTTGLKVDLGVQTHIVVDDSARQRSFGERDRLRRRSPCEIETRAYECRRQSDPPLVTESSRETLRFASGAQLQLEIT